MDDDLLPSVALWILIAFVLSGGLGTVLSGCDSTEKDESNVKKVNVVEEPSLHAHHSPKQIQKIVPTKQYV